MVLDHEQCYRAVTSRDARFDGWFVGAVRTTGIYCRPSCPAVTPKPANIEFFPTAAAAHEHGYRACKRCRPDATPGSPEWDVRGDVVARAMRLIGDGVIDREGVSGLARRLHYSERHLNRLITDELGAGPLAIARAQRATTARVLIETSSMPFTTIAFAAGFRSIRQFNDTVQAVFSASPSQLRAAGAGRSTAMRGSTPGSVTVDLAVRQPFELATTMAFLAARSVRGIEHFDGVSYHRALSLPNGHGIAVVDSRPVVKSDRTHVRVTLRLNDWRDLAPAVQRVRRLFDLDADPVAIDGALLVDPELAGLVDRHRGLRVPGSVDPFETAVRAIVGQQVSVAGARTILGRITAAAGSPLALPDDELTHVFPTPEQFAAIDTDTLPMPVRRRATLVELAERVDLGKIVLDAGADRAEVRQALLDVPGIGPWTADYVLMRGLGDPDVFLDTDLGVRQALARLGESADRADSWRPWRSYAMHHLWESLGKEPLMNHRTTVDSPIGTITLVADGDALVEVQLPNGSAGGELSDAAPSTHPVLDRAASQLREYFAGERREFDVPLAPQGTEFQLAAWQALRTIPYGDTVSYGEQARRLGDRKLARAVGAANGRNPLPIIVPCHRVVGANGHLTGFGGGIECKAWLLDHERSVRASAMSDTRQ